MAMAEEQSVYYVDLALCTSRETEVNMLKKEPALEFTSDGAIRLSKKHPEASADTTGELRVRLCMQRRAWTFQIANIATFVTLDSFIAKLFALLTKKPIAGYKVVSLAQIIAADQALWQKVSQETRGEILTSGDPKPIDQAVQSFMDAAEVTYHLLPMRDGPKSDPRIKDPKPKKNPKNPNPRDRRPAGEDRDPKTLKIDIPDGCTVKNDSNQNICFAFNRKACPVRGFKCRRGIHVCWKKGCFGKHALPDCPKEKTSERRLRGSVMDGNDPGPSACVSTPKGSHSAELNLPDIKMRLKFGIFTFDGGAHYANCSRSNSMFHRTN